MDARGAHCKTRISFGRRLRIIRKRLADRSLSGTYRKLARLVPKITDHYDKTKPESAPWLVTPHGSDGWAFFTEAEIPLTKDELKELWLEYAVEIQEFKHGEWNDVFTLP